MDDEALYCTQEDDRLDLLVGSTAIGDYLGISRARLLRLIELGALPVFRLGPSYAARKSSLIAAIKRLEAGDHAA